MAAAPVSSPCAGRRDSTVHDQKIQQRKTGLDDGREDGVENIASYMFTTLARRCDSLCMERDGCCRASPLTSSWCLPHNSKTLSRNLASKFELLETTKQAPSPYGTPPPCYSDAILDAPPDYSISESLAHAKLLPHHIQYPTYTAHHRDRPPAYLEPLKPMTLPKVDFDDSSNFQSHAGKKDKKKQKAADKAKWAGDNSGDEGNKEEGNGEENAGGAGGGAGGGSNNGDGGAGGDGGDDWDVGNSKKKKKGKKGKAGVEEEEENKKKEEEGEEEKRKNEADAAAETGGDPLAWAEGGEANGDDDWGGFTTKKPKKGKKGKSEPEPPATNPPTTNAFDDINLDDSAPKLDINFGTSTTKGTTSTFGGISGWTGGWGASTRWGTDGADATSPEATEIAASKNTKPPTTNLSETSTWSFGGITKNKQKTTTSSFGFTDYGALDEIQEDIQHSKIDEPVKSLDEDDHWGGGFSSVNPKGKKNKKKGIAEELPKSNDTPVVDVPVVEATSFADDPFGGWGKKKDKKAKANDTPTVPPPPPAAPAPPAVDEEWRGTFGKKDKKKSKKGGVDEPPKIEEPVPVVTEPEVEADNNLGLFTTKSNNKKKAKKDQIKEITQSEEPSVITVPEVEPVAVNGWGILGAKKGKNKGKPMVAEGPNFNIDLDLGPMDDEGWGAFSSKMEKRQDKEVAEEPSALADPTIDTGAGPEPFVASPWGALSTKKEKKKGNNLVEEDFLLEEAAANIVPETEPVIEDGWSAFPTKNSKKKGKKGTADGATKAEAPAVVLIPEIDVGAGASWGSWGSKAKENKTAGISVIKDEPIVDVSDLNTEAAATNLDDDWTAGSFGKKKDKMVDKTKRGMTAGLKADEPITSPQAAPVPVAAAISLIDSPTDGIWGASKKAMVKKSKKGQNTSPEPVGVIVPESVVEETPEPVEDDWDGGWAGLSSKEKKKKEKEKEKKEKEEKEKKEKEEKEKKDREEKEKEAEKKKGGKKGVLEVEEEPKVSDLVTGSIADVAAESSWGSWGGAKKEKKKAGKKDFAFGAPPPAPTPPAMGLTPEPEAAQEDTAEDDWGSFAPAKTKGGKTKETLPRTTSTSKPNDVKDSKAGGKSTVDKSTDLFSTLEESPLEEAKADTKNDSPKEETPAKAARGFWGSMSSTAAPKGKTGKEKEKEREREREKEREKEDEEERARKTVEMANPMDFMDEIIDIIDEPPAKKEKGSKPKADSKLTKASSKESDKAGKADDKKKKAEADALIDIAEEEPAQWPDTSKDGKDKDAKGKINTNDAISNRKEESWTSSFWGGSKKTGVKKGDEAKKEIGKQDSTEAANQNVDLFSLNRIISNEPEVAAADESLQPDKTSKVTTTSKMSAAKANNFATSKPLSVSEKVKALEKERLKKTETKFTAPPPPPPAPEPLPQVDPPLKKVTPLSKTKASSASKTATLSSLKKKEPSPPPKDDHKASKDSVPGSFPSEGAEDDIIGFVELPPTDKKIKKKAVKAAKTETQPEPELKMDDYLVEAPAPPAPPTPPPEPAVISKPVKKERARVVRDEGVSSWGFWGAAPKKEIKRDRRSKDDADATSPSSKEKAPAPGLSRSKSTRTPREKEKEELSRSSGSDKIKKAEARPPKSRGASFSGLFGGPSPARIKSTRRPSAVGPRSSSRQQSVDAGALGMPSPPPDDQPAMNEKAARFLGRQPSTRGKQKASGAPDPYPIDDDDMVMVNGLDDPIINAPLPQKAPIKDARRDKPLRSKSKREVGASFVYPQPGDVSPPGRLKSTRGPRPKDSIADRSSKPKQSRYLPEQDDIVMVEANEGTGFTPGPEDLAFAEQSREPPPLKRSGTTPKKPGGISGLFGSFRKTRGASETYDRPKTNGTYGDEDETLRRKRTGTGGDDGTKRIRRDERKVRHSSRRDGETEGYTNDAAPYEGGLGEVKDAEARREEKRAQRVPRDRTSRAVDVREQEERKARDLLNDKAATEARKAKIRELRAREVRGDEGNGLRGQDDEQAQRGAEDKEIIDDTQATRELDDQPIERRTKHRDRNHGDAYLKANTSSRPHKSDRRHSHLDKPLPLRTATEEAERRIRHDERHSRRVTPNEKPSTSRRKTAPAVDDYFDPRNGARDDAEPYLHPITGANDHTSSWVKSQIIEPPPPPPIEPTVIEPPPILGEDGGAGAADDDDDIRRSRRKSSRRRSKYPDAAVDEVDEKSRRRERREREIRSSEGSGEPERRSRRRSEYVSPRPAAGGRRESWFKKITNF